MEKTRKKGMKTKELTKHQTNVLVSRYKKNTHTHTFRTNEQKQTQKKQQQTKKTNNNINKEIDNYIK